jgi:hypothetical protein
MHLPRFLGALALLALPLPACGPAMTSGGGAGGASGAGGAAGAGGSSGVGTTSVCDTDPRAQSYAVGLTQAAMDGAMKARFVDAMPAPPSKGANTWTLEITDGKGNPVSGAKIAVKPFMPDHGHGSSITPQVMPMAAEGTYQVNLLEFFMAGIWQTTLTITPASGPADVVVFTFCVDG